MLDDTLKKGCQTKWKYVIIMIGLAALALGLGFLVEHGQAFQFYGKKLQVEHTWRASEEPAPAFSYEAGGKSLYLRAEGIEISVPCGIDALIPGNDGFAIITGGSGVLTRTEFYDKKGSPQGRLDLKEGAMVRGICLDGGFLGLCYGSNGAWSLVQCRPDGSVTAEVALEAEICYDIVACGDGFVVETEQALLFYSQDMECCGSYLLGTQEVVAWAGGARLLAAVVRHQGAYHLKTLSKTGELLGEAELPMEIRDLEVIGCNVCILDFESLQVYDAFSHCYAVSQEGSRAVALRADTRGLWLLGEGEAMYLTP